MQASFSYRGYTLLEPSVLAPMSAVWFGTGTLRQPGIQCFESLPWLVRYM